nr:DUF5114 domain-containing protein [uncultured Carboxylicivirga sp.]
MKNHILYIIIALFAVFTSCEKEGDKLTVSGLTDPTVVASGESVVLKPAMRKAPVLALSWEDSKLEVNDPAYGVTDEFPYVRIELSATEDFKTYQSIQPTSSVHAITGGKLNTICRLLGFEPDVKQTLYIRVNTSYGRNTTPLYGNVLTFDVTTYYVDLYRASILNKEREDTGYKLYSPEANGVFYGFTGVDAWYNWFMMDGDYELWGNDGVAGTAFLLSSDEPTFFNMWYPGASGCYFTTVNTPKSQWNTISIPTLSVSGAVTGEMTFDQDEVKWVFPITTSEDNATVKVSTKDAALYNMSTGDREGEKTEIGFIPSADGSLTFAESADAATEFTFGAAGDYTLTLYLSDYSNLYYEIKDGIDQPDPEPEVYENLYLIGITAGDWNFDNYISLLSEADLTYAGIVNANSEWGYQMAVEVDNWSDVYTMGQAEGTLEFKGEGNIPAPAAGITLVQADLKNLTYSHTSVGNEIYLAGLNDVWNFTDAILTNTGNEPGIYTGTAEVYQATTYGVKIYLQADNWDTFMAGSTDKLILNGNDAPEAIGLANGTYNVTVDLIGGTCTFQAQ